MLFSCRLYFTGQNRRISSGKEQCYLNTENVTRFPIKLTITPFGRYRIKWRAWRMDWIYPAACRHRRERKNIAARKCWTGNFSILSGFGGESTEAAYIIPFLNVYAAPNADDYLIVDVNGGYHKAVISENVKDSDTVFDFKKTEESINDRFEVNPENATQLLWGRTVYQVTSVWYRMMN